MYKSFIYIHIYICHPDQSQEIPTFVFLAFGGRLKGMDLKGIGTPTLIADGCIFKYIYIYIYIFISYIYMQGRHKSNITCELMCGC